MKYVSYFIIFFVLHSIGSFFPSAELRFDKIFYMFAMLTLCSIGYDLSKRL